MKKIVFSILMLGSVYANAQQLLEVLKPHTILAKAQVWDRTHYIASFNHNGANIDGVLANSGANLISLPIAYNEATIGQNHPEVNVQRTVQDRNGNNVVLTLHIPAGTFTQAKGLLTATIKIGNGSTDSYRVKQIAANTDEEIANFKFKLLDEGRETTVKLIASGGVLDKKFGIRTNGLLEHQFIYVPVSAYPSLAETVPDSGEPYEKKWLNNNLGAIYAKLGDNNHAKQATSKTDHRAYGSLFEWNRDSDGHELITWTSATAGNFTYTRLHNTDFLGTGNPKTNPGDACPTGYHTPTMLEQLALRAGITLNSNTSDPALAASRNPEPLDGGGVRKDALWLDKTINLPAAGIRFSGPITGNMSRLNFPSIRGEYHSSTSTTASNSYGLLFQNNINIMNNGSRTRGLPIRCIADGQ